MPAVLDDTSCKFPGPPTCRIAYCARSTTRRSIIAVRISRSSAHEVLAGHASAVFKTTSPVVIFPASGTGAWEAALVNTLSPGDHVLMAETGHFATLWHKHGEQARPRTPNSSPATGAMEPMPRAIEARLRGRPQAGNQSGVRRAQRNFDRRTSRHC